MRYWDASAIVPLVIAEATSDRMRALLDENDLMVTWGWTTVEISSALERRAREGSLDRRARREALERLHTLSEAWDEVIDLPAVRQRATRLLARHPLRAADAGQLAAALIVAPESGPAFPFVCLDQGLATAAEGEGLRSVPELHNNEERADQPHR